MATVSCPAIRRGSIPPEPGTGPPHNSGERRIPMDLLYHRPATAALESRTTRTRLVCPRIIRTASADAEGSPPRRVSEDDVERRGELADPGTLERREVDGHGIAGLRVLEFLIDEVACVAR